MAYTSAQKRLIARELARSGGNVSAARSALRGHLQFFKDIGENTIRRVIKEPGFVEMIAEEGKLLAEAEREGAAVAERERARKEAQGTIIARLAGDEAMLDDVRKRVMEVVQGTEKVDPVLAVRLFGMMCKITDRRRESTIPVMADTTQGQDLVEACQETVIAQFGAAKLKAFFSEVSTRYQDKQKARQEKEKVSV